ncbi:MAG: YggT family protein [Chloroflexi bacterium]|nr:YggT family protein [Chloroflexota bacterium]
MSASEATSSVRPLPVARFLGLLLNVLCVLVGVRFLLILVGANVDQPIVAFLISFTDPISAPFEGVFEQPADDAGILPIDLGALLGIGALQLAAAFIRIVARRARELE